MRPIIAFLTFVVVCAPAVAAERLSLVWPTPSTAWAEGKPIAAYIQHAGSGDPDSGTFGSVRSAGHQFHEGIDIRCVSRDRRGEPLDPIFAAMAGVVQHVSARAGDSSYGRYVVLEHPQHRPAVFTLYAHLSKIAPGVRVGTSVSAGQVLGTMGYSSDRPFPKDRAHLHFEIGLMATRDFQRWYNSKKFGSRNEQGVWNGMNLLGVDPLAVFNGWRDGRFATMEDVFAQLTPAVKVRIATHHTPDFVSRYPALLTKPLPMGPVAGWEIVFSWTGLPFAWTPLTATEVLGLAPRRPLLVEVNATLERKERSKTLAVARKGTWHVGKDLENVLQQLFALR